MGRRSKPPAWQGLQLCIYGPPDRTGRKYFPQKILRRRDGKRAFVAKIHRRDRLQEKRHGRNRSGSNPRGLSLLYILSRRAWPPSQKKDVSRNTGTIPVIRRASARLKEIRSERKPDGPPGREFCPEDVPFPEKTQSWAINING